jgi:glycosyltransferase involved in cell wall biosynthesis
MVPVSIVIITRDEARFIPRCIKKARNITDDIIIVDSGSADGTPSIARAEGCRVVESTWAGYGANKNKGIRLAKYDWILSIDADEVPDDELINSLHHLDLNDPLSVYDIRFRSYFGQKLIRFGSWGRDHHTRLFNRACVKWSETMVHETLVMPNAVSTKKLKGCLHHYSVNNRAEYDSKCGYYSNLSARQYFANGQKAGFVKLYISPLFGFVKNYIFFFGFLDGSEGWEIAKITLKNTRLKYLLLSQMEVRQHKKETVKENLAVDY